MSADYTRLSKFLGAFAVVIFFTGSGIVNAYDDKASLEGVKIGKIAFDMKEGNGKLLLAQLGIVEETRQSLIQQGVQPHFYIAFRGPASKLVQSDQEKIKPEDREFAAKIAAKLKEMRKAPGVEGFEQCALASRQQETKTDQVLPEISVVGNGFISLMAYQAKGYAYIAP